MSQYQSIVEKQRAFYATGKTKRLDYRTEQLKVLRDAVVQKHEAIEAALKKDLRKSEFEAFATETSGILDEINAAVNQLEQWIRPVEVDTPPVFGQARSRIYYEPYGCVLLVSTWNYPFVLCFKPLVGALAAGNCCILKPSEVAPESSKVIADIVNQSFDEHYCHVVECDAEATAELLTERFDFIHYTGSTKVGRLIAQAAANHLTPTVLEMGGKNPCIIDKSADIGRSVQTICWGKFLNSGQTCVAPDYLLVHQDVKEELIEALRKQINAFYGDDIQSNPDYGRIVNLHHFDKIKALMEEGNIVIGGRTDADDLFVEPTVIDGVSWENKIMQEEIFGPVFPIVTFNDMSEVIESLAKREKPLALYLYATDVEVQKRLVEGVSFGGGCINATIMHMLNTNMPFGGVGNSGIGGYQGRWSIETFSHKKSILDRALTDDPSPLFPPYRDNVKFLKSMYLG